MGTTDLSLERDSGVEIALVLAVEGFEDLIVSREPVKAATAWAGTDWARAVSGLRVSGDIAQGYTPLGDPVPKSRITVMLSGVAGDRFGEQAFARGAGNQTELREEIDASDTIVPVLGTESFSSSGTIWIGGERIDYSSKTGDSFAGCTRGTYAPFKAGSEINQRFGQTHRVEVADLGVTVPPLVSDRPRFWVGRRCGLWVHRIVGGVWDIRSQARLDFAGRIVDLLDADGETVLTVDSIFGDLGKATLGVDRYRAIADQRVFIEDGSFLQVLDLALESGSGAVGSNNKLTFFDSPPAGKDNAQSGYYTSSDLISELNRWFRTLEQDGDSDVIRTIRGIDRVSLEHVVPFGSEFGANAVRMILVSNARLLEMLGFQVEDNGETEIIQFTIGAGNAERSDSRTAVVRPWSLNLRPELRVSEYNHLQVSRNITVQRTSGEWYNNRLTAPQPWRNLFALVPNWGFVRIGDFLGPVEFVDETTIRVMFRGLSSFMVENLSRYEDNIVEIDDAGRVLVEQVPAIEGKFGDIVRKMLLSTDGSGYNDPLDQLPRSFAVGIPNELLGERFTESVVNLDSVIGSGAVTIVIDEPTSFSDLFKSDLIIRQAFFVFEDNTIQLSTISSPLLANAHHSLDESNKARPTAQRDSQRTPIRFTTEFLLNVIKIQYGRRRDGSYKFTRTIRNQPSIDEFGGARPVTIKMRNLYEGNEGAGDIVASFAAQLIRQFMPLFGRAIPIAERSISHTMYHAVPGDSASFTDNYARDPSTGKRGVTALGATVIRQSHSWGDSDTPNRGSIQVLLFEQGRNAPYASVARVDRSVDTGGFSGGYNDSTLTLRARDDEYSNGFDDDAERFQPGFDVEIIQVDPDDPDSPLFWDRVVVSASGSDVEISSSLTGWDPSREYKIISQNYADISADEQRVGAALASQATGLIAGERSARAYALPTQPRLRRDGSPLLASVPLDLGREKIPNRLLIDGSPLDPSLDSAISRDVEILVEHSTAPSCTSMRSLQDPIRTPTQIDPVPSGYALFSVIPMFIGPGPLIENPGLYRYITLKPILWGAGGFAARLRVWSSSVPPTGGPSNITIRPPFAGPLFFNTNSQSPIVMDAQKLLAIAKPFEGICYIIVEGSSHFAFDTLFGGFSRCDLGPLEDFIL